METIVSLVISYVISIYFIVTASVGPPFDMALKTYLGPALPFEQISILFSECFKTNGESISIAYVNSINVHREGCNRPLALVPGKHKLFIIQTDSPQAFPYSGGPLSSIFLIITCEMKAGENSHLIVRGSGIRAWGFCMPTPERVKGQY